MHVHRLLTCVRKDKQELPSSASLDCASVAWKSLGDLCCGTCCLAWCQCFGICAVAQEHDHLKKHFPETDIWQRDDITLQPWGEYLPKILQLRKDKIMNLTSHWAALSELSVKLWQGTVAILGIMIAVTTLLPVQYSRWQLVVVRSCLRNNWLQTMGN